MAVPRRSRRCAPCSQRTTARRWTSARTRRCSARLCRAAGGASRSLADHEKREAQLKQTLQQAMGDATRAHLRQTGSVTWKKARDSESVDLKRLLQDHPGPAGAVHRQQAGQPALPDRLNPDPFHSSTTHRIRHPGPSRPGWLAVFSSRRTPMLKGLAITPPVLGRISIGKVVEKNGKRLPEKDDQFTITSQVQARDGWLLPPPGRQRCARARTASSAASRSACCSTSRISTSAPTTACSTARRRTPAVRRQWRDLPPPDQPSGMQSLPCPARPMPARWPKAMPASPMAGSTC